MSSIANLISASPALPAVNVHPHGHRHGPHVGSTDDSGSDTAAQVPAGTVQNLFGSLLQTLEQVIGVQTALPASTSTASTAAPAAQAAPAPSSATLLQNYLNNLAQSQSTAGSQSPKFAGPMVRVNA